MAKTIIDEIKALYESDSYEDAIKLFVNFYKANPQIDNDILNTLLAECTTWLDKHPVAELFNLRGIVYSSLKQYEKAIENYNKAIELKPDYALAYNARGIAYAGLKDFEKAIEDLNKTIQLEPDGAHAYNNRGNVYGRLKEYQKAIEDCTKAIQINPGHTNAYYNRGMAYAGLKKYQKAIEDFTRFGQLVNDEYRKAWALKEIKDLKEEQSKIEIKVLQNAINTIKSILKFEGEFITHYTNMVGAKALLTNPEASYMNDTSEGEKLKNVVLDITQHLPKNTIPFIGKPFLGSFVAHDKCNDLTLWRMYAKTKGIDGCGCANTLNREQFIGEIRKTFIENETSVKKQENLKFLDE